MIKAIEPLGKHDRAVFSCGAASLDDWFRLRAGQDEKRNVARVFVATDDQGGIVGFYSSSSFTSPLTICRPSTQNACPVMMPFRLLSLGVSHVMRKSEAKGLASFCLLMRFEG